jgi:hypothetical protein
MARPTATPLLASFLASAAVLSTACFDTSSSITTIDYPTRLTVDPLSFRGALSCGAPGLERYVVTLHNVTEDAPREKQMTSSGPVACENFASFGDTFVVSSDFYTATIDGYDRDVVAMGGDVQNLVKPTILDVATGQEIAPKWTTSCGEVPPYIPDAEAGAVVDAPYNQLRFPTRALGNSEVILHGCLPLAAIPLTDASTGDGSSGGEDASVDGGGPADATGPTDDGGVEDGGIEGGGSDAGGSDAGEGDADDGGADAVAAARTAAKRRGSR